MENPKEKFDRIMKNIIRDVQQKKDLRVNIGYVLGEKKLISILLPRILEKNIEVGCSST